MDSTLTWSVTSNRTGPFSWCRPAAPNSQLIEMPELFSLGLIAGPETLASLPYLTPWSSPGKWKQKRCINQYFRFQSPFDSLWRSLASQLSPSLSSGSLKAMDIPRAIWRPLLFRNLLRHLHVFFLLLFLLFVLGKWSIDFWLLLFFNVSCEKDSAHLLSSFPSRGGLGGFNLSVRVVRQVPVVVMPGGWSVFSGPPAELCLDSLSLSVCEKAQYSPCVLPGAWVLTFSPGKICIMVSAGGFYYYILLAE